MTDTGAFVGMGIPKRGEGGERCRGGGLLCSHPLPASAMEPPDEIPEGTERIRPMASMGFRDFRLLWTAGVFASTGRDMRQVVNLYLVYAISGSAVQLGLTGLFQALPIMALGLFGGALADVIDRRRLLLFTQIVGMAPAVALAALTITDQIAVWHIFAATMVTSATQTLESPGRMSYLPKTVPRSHLLNAVALDSLVTQMAFFVGPLLMATVVLIGVEGAYILNAALFIPGILAVLVLKTSGKPEGPTSARSLGMVREGLRFIMKQRVLQALLAIDFGVVLVGFFRPMLPILADKVYGVEEVGLAVLNAAPAVGSIAAIATVLWLGRIRRQGALFVIAVALYGVSLVALGLSPWFWMGLIAAAGLGYTDSISVAIRNNVTQSVSPDNMRGRATGFLVMAATLGNALGSIEAGLVAAAIGVGGALTFGGLGAIGFVVVAATVGWRELWRHRA